MDMLAMMQNQAIDSALKSAGALDLGGWFSFEVEAPTRQTLQVCGE
jgi:hypothetical protein